MLRKRLLYATTGALLFSGSVAALQSESACPGGVCIGLGQGFFLPAVDTQVNLKGTQLLESPVRLGECAFSTPVKLASDEFTSSSSMKELVDKLATSSNVGGNATVAGYTMKASIAAQTQNDSRTTSSFSSVIYDRKLVDGSVELVNSEDCFSTLKLSADFISHFENLPIKLTKNGEYVTDDDSWQPYNDFLVQFGSHYLTQLQFGSRFQIWQSTNSSEKDTSNLLKARACLSVTTPTAGGQGGAIDACSSFSKETLDKSNELEVKSNTVIRGGTDVARKKLASTISKENMNEFIMTADKASQAVGWSYKPIWDTLKTEYYLACKKSGNPGSKACGNLQRANNLQAAYEGMGAWGCEYKPLGTTKTVLAGMKLGSVIDNETGVASWSCMQAKTGCVDDSACHYAAGVVSHCYGDRCLDQQLIPGTKEFRTVVKPYKTNTGNDEGVNNSCVIGYGGFASYCRKDWAGGLPERAIWKQSALIGSMKATASAAEALGPNAASDEQVLRPDGLHMSYQVKVKFTDSGRKLDQRANQIDPIGVNDGAPDLAPGLPEQSVVISYPRGINCPGAGCGHEFRTGEEVTIAWFDGDNRIKLNKWDGNRCQGASKKVPAKVAMEAVNIDEEDLKAIIINAKQASLCSFIVTEDIELDLEVVSKGNMN